MPCTPERVGHDYQDHGLPYVLLNMIGNNGSPDIGTYLIKTCTYCGGHQQTLVKQERLALKPEDHPLSNYLLS